MEGMFVSSSSSSCSTGELSAGRIELKFSLKIVLVPVLYVNKRHSEIRSIFVLQYSKIACWLD